MLRKFPILCLSLLGLCALFPWPAHARVDVEDCQLDFDHLRHAQAHADFALHDLDSDKRTFLRDHFLPLVGKRLLYQSPGVTRTVRSEGDWLILGGFGEGHELRIRFVDKPGTEPRVAYDSEGRRVLVVSRGFDFKTLPRQGGDVLRRFLTGHPLQPQTDYKGTRQHAQERRALGEDALHLREVQIQGRDAARHSILSGDSAFLYVSPTGTGKTEILKSVFETQLERGARGETPGLHVLIAHTDELVKQLFQDMQSLSTQKVEFVRWGGSEGEKSPTLPDLMKRLEAARARGNQVILISTTKSLLNATQKEGGAMDDASLQALVDGKKKVVLSEAGLALLRGQLGTIAIDEAHHAGAPNTHALLEGLLDKKRGSRAFLFGPTATPTHREVELARDLFGANDFWAYLDTPESYRDRQGRETRSIEHVVRQLKEAIDRGDLSDFEPVFLDPEKFEKALGRPLFTNDLGEGRFVIDPALYDGVLAQLAPYFKRHRRGFIAARTTLEAERITEQLKADHGDVPMEKMYENGQVPNQMFAYLHSDMDPDEKKAVMEAFKQGKIRFLVTVNMLDEGIDVPDMSLYVDLTRSTDPKQLLQRLGRVLRLYPGKDLLRKKGKPEVQMVTFQDVTDKTTADLLLKLDAIHKDRLLGEEEEAEKDPHEPRPKPTPPTPEDKPLPAVQWTPEQLLHLRKFFVDDTRGLQKAHDEADDVVKKLRARHSDETAFFAEQSGPVRRAVDLIAARDAMAPTKKGREAFFEKIANSGQHSDGLVKQYRQDRARVLQQIKTPEGLAQVSMEFLRARGQAVNRDSLNQDQTLVLDTLLQAATRGDLPFLRALYDLATPRELSRLGVADRVEKLLVDPLAVEATLLAFHEAEGRVPDPQAHGFEGVLASAIDKVITAPESQLARHEELALQILEQREARHALQTPPVEAPAAPVPLKISPSEHPPSPAVVKAFEPAPVMRDGMREKLEAAVERKLSEIGPRWTADKPVLEELKTDLAEYKTLLADLAEARDSGLWDLAAETEQALSQKHDQILSPKNTRALSKKQALTKPAEVTFKLNGPTTGNQVLLNRYVSYAQSRGWKVTAPQVSTKGGFQQEAVVTVYGEGVAKFFAREAEVGHFVEVVEDRGTYKGQVFTPEVALSIVGESRHAQKSKPRRRYTRDGLFTDARVPKTAAMDFLTKLQSFHDALEAREFELELQTP